MEARCVNTACPYWQKGGRCGLFPGEQWHSCKRSGTVPAAKKAKTSRRAS